MKSFFNTIINWLFKKSWITLLLGLAVPFLFTENYNGWILFVSLLYFFPAAIIHYKGKCAVKKGTKETLKPLCEAILEAGIQAAIV